MQGLSTQIKPIPGRWWKLAGVWALYMAFGLNMAGLAPLVPDIEADLGFSHAPMGTVLGASALSEPKRHSILGLSLGHSHDSVIRRAGIAGTRA